MASSRAHIEKATKALAAFVASSSGSTGTGWRLADADHPVQKFADALQDPRVRHQLIDLKAESVISLPEGVQWLGLQNSALSNQIFIRECYLAMQTALHKYMEKKKVTKHPNNIITGTPGIGKSHLAAVFVGQALAKGQPVMLENVHRHARDYYWFEVQDGVHRVCVGGTREEALKKLMSPSDEPRLYVVDGGARGICSVRDDVTTLTFSSPSKDVMRDVTKCLANVVLYTPLFSLSELQRCKNSVARFQALQDDHVEAWYNVAGGIARTCLLNASQHDTIAHFIIRVQNYFSGITSSELKSQLANITSTGFPEGSDAVIHWAVLPRVRETKRAGSPEEDHLRLFSKRMLQIASPTVLCLALMAGHVKDIMEMASFCLRNADDLARVATAGYWFKALAHVSLAAGGQFQCRMLTQSPRASRFTLSLPRCSKIQHYSSAPELAEICLPSLEVFCIPTSLRAAAIDSASSPAAWFQVTRAGKHGIHRKAAFDLCNAMAAQQPAALQQLVKAMGSEPPSISNGQPFLFFVVPRAQFDSSYTTLQTYTDQGKKGDVPQSALVNQAVLCIDLETMATESGALAHTALAMKELSAAITAQLALQDAEKADPEATSDAQDQSGNLSTSMDPPSPQGPSHSAEDTAVIMDAAGPSKRKRGRPSP
ncbi:hypothetical protein WJX74_004195 [Apatococcus lobatus]|uniref:Uncharacterized protein n=1 Tax=Apatococcus lobatus TaxID=904363 RepID=A0AAW1QHB7_9CHLO